MDDDGLILSEMSFEGFLRENEHFLQKFCLLLFWFLNCWDAFERRPARFREISWIECKMLKVSIFSSKSIHWYFRIILGMFKNFEMHEFLSFSMICYWYDKPFNFHQPISDCHVTKVLSLFTKQIRNSVLRIFEND